MIDYTLDEANAVLHLRPRSALQKGDFEQLTRVVDPYLAKSGKLSGLIVEAPRFPGWDSFGALAAHLRFARDHHRRIARIAVVTDSTLGDVAEKLAGHFVAAEIRHFAAGDLESARKWVVERG